jgi:diguanylate cyclase (GGDEF)-like protein
MRGVCVFVIYLISFTSNVNAAPFIALEARGVADLKMRGMLYLASGDSRPPSFPDDFNVWERGLTPASGVNLFGGDYWLIARINNVSGLADWVLDPNGTIIGRVEAWIVGPSRDNGNLQRLEMGYEADYEYLLHYGKHVRLEPDASYTIAVRFQSPYFASSPGFSIVPRPAFVRLVGQDTLFIVGALGALVMLALYNLFIFVRTRDSSLFFYSAYLLFYAVGWGLTFNLGAHVFGLRDLRWHYVPFFLLPVLNILFYLRFLKLEQYHPGLAKLSRAVIALSLLLLPSCFLALSYAHTLATLVIGLFVMLAFVSGIVVWRKGFQPARFFILAFLCLLIPALFILPANIGLIPDLVSNSELWTLMGGTLDGLLLAFALAERINQLEREKDAALLEANRALTLAHTDALTKLGNRQAFERDTERLLSDGALISVDLDGLKRINDLHGHTRGDALLRDFAASLSALPKSVSSYRLGGDEFVILACIADVPAVQTELQRIEARLRLEGFPEAGVSFGVATVMETNEGTRLNELADARMYQHKFERRKDRTPSA